MALLNAAAAIYLGDKPVRRIYLGSRLVWQPPLDQLIALAGSAGFVHIVGVSPAWQDAGRTVPAGDGDPVCVIDDLTGNGYHWVAPNDAARPALVQAGAHWHLLFDGVDDYMTCPSFGTPSWPHDGSGATLAMAVQDLSAPANQYSLFATARLTSHNGVAIISTSQGGFFSVTIQGGGSRQVSTSGVVVSTARLLRLEHASADDPQYTMHRNHDLLTSGSYAGTPSSADASYTPYLMRSVQISACMTGKWYGGCLLPVTGHGDLVDSVLQAHMPPILEPSP